MKKVSLFPDEIVHTSEYFTVSQDCEVPIPGFFIVASRRNIRSIADFTDEEAKEYIKLLRYVRQAMSKIMNIKDVYFFQNEDTDHGFHVWIFPRHSWMEKFGRKIQSVRPIMEYAQKEMRNEAAISEVRKASQEMRNYLESF